MSTVIVQYSKLFKKKNFSEFRFLVFWGKGVGPHDLSVSPSPLGTNWAFELGCTGLGLG